MPPRDAPAVVIVLPFEDTPQVVPTFLNDRDERRYALWLERRRDIRQLLERALEIQARERAA